MTGLNLANGLIAFGVLYALVVVLTLVSSNLFGILNYPVNTLDHVLDAVIAVASIGVGWWARNAPAADVLRRA